MSSSETQTSTTTSTRSTLRLVGGENQDVSVSQWKKELSETGLTIVRGAISRERAAHYVHESYKWLESWGLGFDRNDKSTYKSLNLPYSKRNGIFHGYSIPHEQFVWDLKSEPTLIQKFEEIWGTKELLVSYDAINLSIPEIGRQKTDPIFQPWAHVDQSPLRTNLQCIQGIVNLLPNGPEDGGLMVLKGSSTLYAKLWEHFDHKKGPNGWNKHEQQFLDDEMNDWLLEKGCEWVKVCAEPGDLLLWDSRTVHYGVAPSSTNPRFAVYVCYKPAHFTSNAAAEERRVAFENKDATAHDPSIVRIFPKLPPIDHPTYQAAKDRPLPEPVLSKRGRQLAGLEAY